MPNYTLQICHGPSCSACFADDLDKKAKEVIANNKITNIQLITCGCTGNCTVSPTIRIINHDTQQMKEMHEMTPKEIEKVIKELAEKQ